MDYLRGFLGLAILIGIAYLFSADKKKIDWKMVGTGLAMQLVLALLILKVPVINWIFEKIAGFFVLILNYTEEGAAFIFGNIVTDLDSFGYIFAFQVLPTIVFFSALSAILYYFGILQFIIKGMAWVMTRTLGLSGPESLAAAANVFIGQTEAPLVVKPYLEKMTKSEMLCLMTGGMATIAGGVFAAYIGFLGGDDPVMREYFATHLLTASIISAPAAIIAAKILYPEQNQETLSRDLSIAKEEVGSNLLDAISKGTTDGLKLAINVGAMLLVFTALIYMVNSIFLGGTDVVNSIANFIAENVFNSSVGDWNENIKTYTDGRTEGFTFSYLLGLIFSPVAWIIGTPTQDLVAIGELLGTKTVVNEFVAYGYLPQFDLTPKGKLIATYALCGFANFASIGIQIGGIGAIAPGQRKVLSEFGIKALIGGTIACLMTAAIAGMIAG